MFKKMLVRNGRKSLNNIYMNMNQIYWFAAWFTNLNREHWFLFFIFCTPTRGFNIDVEMAVIEGWSAICRALAGRVDSLCIMSLVSMHIKCPLFCAFSVKWWNCTVVNNIYYIAACWYGNNIMFISYFFSNNLFFDDHCWF